MLKSIIISWIAVGIALAGILKPLPLHIEQNPPKASLGKKLFFDKQLSRDTTISCASCHDLQHGGDDGRRVSIGIHKAEGVVNAPTVYNSVFNFRQFWDGRARDLKDQAPAPIENPVEMGFTMKELVIRLKKDPTYMRLFSAIYPEGITPDTIADAIAEYEKGLITPNASFDRYLRGDTKALSEQAKKGYRLFQSKGCVICHNGVNIGGNLYNKFGIYHDANSTQLGRYNITKRPEDKFVFKVPSLRNVALTAPYMHDGRFKTLEQSVQFMTEYQLGRGITPEEVAAIIAFLKSLTGEIPPGAKRRP